ncbi:hypothetical protein [Bacillus gobiensis]|uniref:hypothetical protein n=1 Tax=Bacillus gobiensis TaxID=1441095 RepID=UPI003D1E1945
MKKIHYLSLITVVIFSLVPRIGIQIEGTHYFFGFPAQWLAYYGGWLISFKVWNLLFDFFVFYFAFIILKKLGKEIKVPG